MRSETFTLHGQEFDDGRIYITSTDLPGFRLFVVDRTNMDYQIIGALRMFYPIYIAAKARTEAKQRQPRLSKASPSRGSFDLSAEFSFA